ncbi:MAG: DUF2029 domain-containing protein, partial [Chloroflexota bacterium]|nr:DUF2029 domain-containing protein [Chloroflexota bacterium]
MLYLRGVISTRYWPLGVDVYPTWNGTRAMWLGENPYSSQVQLETQQLIHGRPSQPDEDSFWFYYPPYIAVITLPLVFLPVQDAAVVMAATLCALLLALIVLWAWELKPRPAPWLFALVLLSGILFRPAVISIINGQYALFIVACGALAWWLIGRKQDFAAGALLAFATFKPSVALFVPLVLLAWAARWKRWRLLISFAASMFLLVVLPILRIGWWPPEFIRQTLAFTAMHRGEGMALAWLPEQIATVPGIIWLGGTLALLGIGIL